jgi:hypothetical protein
MDVSAGKKNSYVRDVHDEAVRKMRGQEILMRLPLQLALIALLLQYSDLSCCGSQPVSKHMVVTPRM